ncbi:MAG: hypothetical protein KGL39_59120 [Patescibacteria group bacterium]|nr:hypothetical protein [Patescibacteria group bacterium]
MDPNVLSATALAGLAVVIALTELFKPIVPAKFYPLVALLVGIGWTEITGVATGGSNYLYLMAQGIVIGLSATGLYAAGKHVVTSRPDTTGPPTK